MAIHATVLVAALSVCGCAGSIDFRNPSAVSSAIKVEYSKQDEATKIDGPEFRQGYNKLSLHAWRSDRFDLTEYSIAVDAIYFGEPRNYDAAFDLQGNKFALKSNFRKKDYCDNSGCWQNENFELSTSRDYLAANRENDLSIRVNGGSGPYQTFTIPAGYVQAFLSVAK